MDDTGLMPAVSGPILGKHPRMSLSRKVTLVLAMVMLVAVATVLIGLPYAFSELTMRQMRAHAETYGFFLRDDLEALMDFVPGLFTDPSQEAKLRDLVTAEFGRAASIGDETGSFAVRMVELADNTRKSRVRWDPSGKMTPWDGDVREVAALQTKKIVLLDLPTAEDPDASLKTMVVPVRLAGPEPWYVIVRMDFQRSMEMHQDQYVLFQASAVVILVVILAVLMLLLLRFIRSTVVRPASKVAAAMDRVRQGDLGVRLESAGADEFGNIGRQFNAMVAGLKERQALSQYVSKSTLDAVQRSIQTGAAFHKPERRDVVVFFSDIRGFTAYSERHDPETVIRTLNRILDLQATIIANHGGDIDKFVGDETMAVFTDAEAAFKAALTIQVLLRKVGSEIDGLKVGIGLSAGSVVQGDVGFEAMKDYTIIGDTVNIAARLQALAKAGQILVAVEAFDPALWARYRLHGHGTFALKGKAQRIPVASLVGMEKSSDRNPPAQ